MSKSSYISLTRALNSRHHTALSVDENWLELCLGTTGQLVRICRLGQFTYTDTDRLPCFLSLNTPYVKHASLYFLTIWLEYDEPGYSINSNKVPSNAGEYFWAFSIYWRNLRCLKSILSECSCCSLTTWRWVRDQCVICSLRQPTTDDHELAAFWRYYVKKTPFKNSLLGMSNLQGILFFD